MKQVYINNLPRHKNGNINWKDSIGSTIKFVNDDIFGVIKIVDYDKKNRKVEIKYNEEVYWLTCFSLIHSNISKITKRSKMRKEYKYKEGDVVNNNKILYRFKNGSYKRYTYECLKCGHIGEKNEADVERHGCPVCNGKNLVDENINSIKITHPNIFKLITDSDGDKYSYGSAHKVNWKCPCCGGMNYTSIKYLTNQDKLPCIFCGDGISYPEKILYGFLSQVSKTYKKQKEFKWSENRKYDAFDLGVFIEIHGEQHYKKAFEKCGGRTLNEEIKNDLYKKQLAISNYKEIVDYIVIKAYPCTFENIKENIQKSNLGNLYNMSKVNWMKIQKDASRSLVCSVAKKYNNGYTIKEISEIYGLHKSTINRYLKMANKLNICNYVPTHRTNTKMVIELNSGKVFETMKDGAIWSRTSVNQISKCTKGYVGYVTAGINPYTSERCRWMLYENFKQQKIS